MPSLASLSGPDSKGQLFFIYESEESGLTVSSRLEESARSLLEFRTDAYLPEFVTVALSRMFQQRSLKADVDLGKLQLPKVDKHQQQDYLEAMNVISAYELFAATTLKQFRDAEHQLISNSAKSAAEFIRGIASLSNERSLSGLRELTTAGFQAAVESLPHHLAVILRLYLKTARAKDRLERMLHFFEAAAALHLDGIVSTLSATCPAFKTVWERESAALRGEHHLSLDRATFGYLCGAIERLRASWGELRESSVGVQSYSRFLDVLWAPEVTKGFRAACNMRNSTVGHGGLLSERTATENLSKLESFLNSYLGLVLPVWQETSFIRCLEITNASDGALYYNCESLMGSNSTYMHEEIVSNPPDGVKKELTLKSLYYYFKSASCAVRSAGLVVVLDDEAGFSCPLFYSKLIGDEPVLAEFKCYHLDRLPVRRPPGDALRGLV